MYNHRKLKSSLFLRDDLYPERVLSRHKHYKKCKLYGSLKSKFLPAYTRTNTKIDSTNVAITELGSKKSFKMLLRGVPELYTDNSLDTRHSGVRVRTFVPSQSVLKDNARTDQIISELGESSKTQPGFQKASKQTSDLLQVVYADKRGLEELEECSFTNGLLESGHRYFRVL